MSMNVLCQKPVLIRGAATNKIIRSMSMSLSQVEQMATLPIS